LTASPVSVIGHIATNVAVITTGNDRDSHGVTANVWAEGAAGNLALVTLRREGGTLGQVVRNRTFAASVLGVQQERIAVQFATRGSSEKRFAGVDYDVIGGCPVLTPCHAWLRCTVVDVCPFGAYDIVTGTIDECGVGDLVAPLLFHGGRFGVFGSGGGHDG
jgi:3-hydroxy-9,10-secoandrosta-1,3,5(10)-triene-9,17-dione monooxygenase reductase component